MRRLTLSLATALLLYAAPAVFAQEVPDTFWSQHPQLWREVERNPDLVDNPSFLAQHPELVAYLQSNPGWSPQVLEDVGVAGGGGFFGGRGGFVGGGLTTGVVNVGGTTPTFTGLGAGQSLPTGPGFSTTPTVTGLPAGRALPTGPGFSTTPTTTGLPAGQTLPNGPTFNANPGTPLPAAQPLHQSDPTVLQRYLQTHPRQVSPPPRPQVHLQPRGVPSHSAPLKRIAPPPSTPTTAVAPDKKKKKHKNPDDH